MGKIVKYCQSCDESFAEKFGFCPNCGKSMQAFEMNPLGGSVLTSVAADKAGDEKIAPVNASESVAAASISPTVAPAADKVETVSKPAGSEAEPIASPTPQAPVKETKTYAAAAAASNGANYKSQTSGDGYRTVESQAFKKSDDYGDFHVNVIEEKDTKRRNLLLLGALLLMMSVASGAMLYSIFNHPLNVGAIGDESELALFVGDNDPMQIEEDKPKKEKEDAGGGGGGGRDKPTPTSKGQLAPQTEQPLMAPSVTNVKKDFELKMQASTQGNKNIPQTDERYGDPNSKYSLASDGMGTGGGQGSGTGNGQGSGRGTGAGTGVGSGYGGGNGTGTGNGRGNGTESLGDPPPPPPKPPKAVVSEKVKIISKPRAEFTEEARKNNFTGGTVTVKVTFLASGQIGSVVAVNGLPYGLTEKAIAAAKAIKFEPAKKDGQPVTSAATFQYSFTLY